VRFREDVKTDTTQRSSPFNQRSSSPFSPSSSVSMVAYNQEEAQMVSVNGWARGDAEGRLASTSGIDEERVARMMTGRVAELQPKPEVQFELDWAR